MEITKRPGLACIRGAPFASGTWRRARAPDAGSRRVWGSPSGRRNTQGLIVLLKVAVDERAENVLVPSDQF